MNGDQKSIFDEIRYQAVEDDAVLNTLFQRYLIYEIKGLDCYFKDADISRIYPLINRELGNENTLEFFVLSRLRERNLVSGSNENYMRKQRIRYLDKDLKVREVRKYLSVSKDPFGKKDPTDPISPEIWENLFQVLELEYRRLGTGEIKRFLYEIISVDDRFNIAPGMSVREELLQNQIAYYPEYMKIGNIYLKVMTLKHLPEETAAFEIDGIIDFFMFDFLFLSSFTLLDQKKERMKLTISRNTARSAKFKSENVDHNAEQTYEEAENLKGLIQKEGHGIVASTQKMILWNEDPSKLKRDADFVKNSFKKHGYFFFEEELFHDREFFRSLPGTTVFSSRGNKVLVPNAMELFPLSRINQGDTGGEFPLFLRTTTGSLYSFDAGFSGRNNWNSQVYGASGSGKSVAMNMLIAHSMFPRIKNEGGKIFIIDFAGAENSSYRKMVNLFNGKFLPIEAGGKNTLNPFPPKRDMMKNGEADVSLLTYLGIVVDMVIGNEGNTPQSNIRRGIVSDGLKIVYENYENPSLPDLVPAIEEVKTEDDEIKREIVKLLKIFIKRPENRLISSRDGLSFDEDPFVVVDLHGVNELTETMRQLITFIVIHEAKRTAFGCSGFKFLILDECAQLIKQDAMVSMVEEMFSTARKYRTSIWTVTQNFLSFKEASLASKISINSTTTIFLSHASDQEAKRLVSRDFGFSERERDAFESLKTVKGKYSLALVKTSSSDEKCSAVVRIELSPFDYWITTSDRSDNEKLEAVMKREGVDIVKACLMLSRGDV